LRHGPSKTLEISKSAENHMNCGTCTNTAITAFEVIKSGNVGIAGSTGAVLHRSLMARRAALVDRPGRGDCSLETSMSIRSAAATLQWLPIDRNDAEERQRLARIATMLLEELRRNTEDLTEIATQATDRARQTIAESNEIVTRARAIRAGKKR
jgi:hypothetical protein